LLFLAIFSQASERVLLTDLMDVQEKLARLEAAVAKLEEGLVMARSDGMSNGSRSQGTEDGTEDEFSGTPAGGDRRSAACKACILLASLSLMSIVAVVLLVVSSGDAVLGTAAPREYLKGATKHLVWPEDITTDKLQFATIAGISDEFVLRASNCTHFAFLAAILSTVTSSAVATFMPKYLPADFNEKGTLSNVSQRIETAWGRMFTVTLFTAAICLMFSNYTFWVYRPWSPMLDLRKNPIVKSNLAPALERSFRSYWAVVPNIGFMIAAAVPSFSVNRDLECVLTAVHNVAAPVSMAFAVVMETVQLSYGENAFASFFSSEPATPIYGPLDNFQRLRVVLCTYAWIAGIIFLSIQVYLGLKTVLGLKIPTSYGLALTSFYCEVIGMCLAFALPLVASYEATQDFFDRGSPMEAAEVIMKFMREHHGAPHGP